MGRKFFKTAEQQQKELDDLGNVLVDGVKKYVTSDKYKQLLSNFSKFHNYSLKNTVLMTMQNPNVTHVASYTDWKIKFNRQVVKGAKSLKIYAPANGGVVWEEVTKKDEKGNILYDKDGNEIKEKRKKYSNVTKFKVASTFDISQTVQIEGKPVVDLEIAKNLEGNVEAYEIIISTLKEMSPVPIRFANMEGNKNGYYSLTDKEIVVKDGLSQVHTIKTMIHEMAHAKLHDEPNFKNQIRFSVVKDGGNPSKEMFSDLGLDEALKKYNSMESDKKCIHFKIDDGSSYVGYFPLIQDGELQEDRINKVDHYRMSEDVQRLITEMQKYFGNEEQLHSIREIQAESIAFVVCNHLGIDTNDYSFPYVTSWNNSTDTKLIEKQLDVIKTTAHSMITTIDKSLDEIMLKPRLLFKIIDSEINGIKDQDMSFAVANKVLSKFNEQYVAENKNSNGNYNAKRTKFKIDVLETNKEPLTFNGQYYAGIEQGDLYQMIDDFVKKELVNDSTLNQSFNTIFLPTLKEASVCDENDLKIAQDIFEERLYDESEIEEELEQDDELSL